MKGFCVIESLAGGDLIIPGLYEKNRMLYDRLTYCITIDIMWF